MSIPADVLADRILALDPDQRLAVAQAWRERGDVAVFERSVESLTLQWASPERLPPRGDEAGWSAREECAVQHGLDSLLRECHPDVGHSQARTLDHEVARVLRDRYVAGGFWHRSRDLILLPRRRWARRPERLLQIGPLVNSCAVVGELAGMLDVRRLPQEAESDGVYRTPVEADRCFAAPLVGADVLSLGFVQEQGGWTYGPVLQEDAIDEPLMVRVLEQAEAAGAEVLVLPEYCCTPAVRERWQAVLRARPRSELRWVLVGSGPTTAGDDNVATLFLHDGSWDVDQPKARPFDLWPDALRAWECTSIPIEADGQPIRERARLHGRWSLVEGNRERLAIAVCESLKPGEQLVSALAAACPTIVLCPVFSKPIDVSLWERAASEFWALRGIEVVVSNSLVVAEWQARAAREALAAEIGAAARRRLEDSTKGHGWTMQAVAVNLVDGTLDNLATIAITKS